jgi:RNA polymerase sigma-70 factor (ECF subfamily)
MRNPNSKHPKHHAQARPAHQDAHPRITDEEFANAYRNGYQLTVRFLLGRGVPGWRAEETAQAAWARGWERRDNLRDSRVVVAWVNTIALNIFRNWYRKRKEDAELPQDVAQPPRSGSAKVDVELSLSCCGEEDRKLLREYYMEGYSSAELAKRRKCSPVAVRVRLMRARRSIQAGLEERRRRRSKAARSGG